MFNSGVFLLELLPNLPSRPIDWITPEPAVGPMQYASRHGAVEGDLYRPGTRGRHPGLVVCLGVVPEGVEHPQVARLGRALARAGIAAFMYWSPAMRDLWLDPDDSADIASAYATLTGRPDIDATRSGLLGTCVGGSFAFLAAADERIRDRIAVVAAFAPYASMWSFARDIASGTTEHDGEVTTWAVDQLTRRVFERSMVGALPASERVEVERALDRRDGGAAALRSGDARAVHALLSRPPREEAASVLEQLSPELRRRLDALSPLASIDQVRAPLIAFGHDRDDRVIPVGESRTLRGALAGRPGAHYTEFQMFEHADPTKRRLKPWRLARELARFYSYLYPLFATTARDAGTGGGRGSSLD